MAEIREPVYRGRDNAIRLRVISDGVPLGLDNVTRAVASIGGALVDSDVDSNVFDWTSGGAGVISMKFGLANLDPGSAKIVLTLYSPEWPDGLVVAHPKGEVVKLMVVESPA